MTVSTKNMFNMVDIYGLMLTMGHPNGTLAKITAIGFETDKLLGTCSECGGLYLLGNLDDQVLSVLGDKIGFKTSDHVSACGKFVSKDRNKYFMTMVDVWVYLLKSKIDVFECIDSFLKLINTQFRKKVKVVRSDNGTEFVNSKVFKLFNDAGNECATSATCVETVDDEAVAIATQIEDNITFKGNNQSIFNGDGSDNSGNEPQTDVRRSSRRRTRPVKFNDFVVNSNVKYGLEKHHMHAPLQSHFTAGLRVQFDKNNKFSLHAFSDANWAKCPISRKSISVEDNIFSLYLFGEHTVVDSSTLTNITKRSLSPSVTVFRAFYTRSYSDGLFSFAKHSISAPSCFPKPPDFIKNWADHFFWVDSCVFPIFVPLYSGGALEKDSAPHHTARQEQTVKLLESHKAPFRRYPKCFLCLVGLSPYYPFDENSYPAFEHPDESEMGLFEFIKTADPRKIQAVEVQKGDNQVKLLESTQHCFMSLVIPAAGGSSSAAVTEVSAPTEEGSSTLGILVDTTVAATTSTRAAVTTKFATDDNPDLAGPSQPEESEGSDDSFYEPPTLDPSEAKRWYAPRWNVTNDSLLDDGFSCHTLVDGVAPPAFFSALHTLDYDQLYTEFNVRAAWQVCLRAEVRSRAEHELELKEKLRAKYTTHGSLLEEKDLEILKLKSQLAEKEVEAAKVIRLRDQVSSLSEEKSDLTAEVSALKVTVTQKDHDISLLNSRATCLASTLDDAKVAYAEAGNKITSLASERDRLASEDFKERMETQQEEQAQELYNRVAELEAHVMDVSSRLEGEFYPTYLTTLAGRRWLLTHGIQLALLKCLKSPKYQGTLGHALGRAVDFGMQEGLEAGYEHGTAGINLSAVDAYNPEVARASYINAVKALEDVDFPLVNLLKSKKDAGIDEVLDCFLLDGPLAGLPEAAYLQPCIEQLSIPIHHAGDKTVVGETSLSFALMNVHARAEGAKKHVAALRQLMMEIVSAPLSSQTWVGEASTSVASLSVEDYDEEDTDEALGSVVAVPKLEICRF
ncbi:putative gypsy type transposase [Tanacetum coccineum]